MKQDPILIFMPGLGDDRRSFRGLLAEFPNGIAVDWIDVLPDESLEQYAVRYAETIRSELGDRPQAPIVLCGYSLGGMIAPYVARQLEADGIVLLCSIRGASQFPKRYYPARIFVRACPRIRWIPFFLAQAGAGLLLTFPRFLSLFVDPDVVRTFYDTPTRRLTELTRMMLDWAYRRRSPNEPESWPCELPTYHLHGTRDFLLPIGLTDPDDRIRGGHLLVHTHPGEVAEKIRTFLDKQFFSRCETIDHQVKFFTTPDSPTS